MNRKTHLSILCAIFIMALAACGGGSKTIPPVETIVVTSGSGQSAVVSTAFTNVLVATVSTGGTPNAGVSVTFAAPATGASGTFAGGGATATVTTDANGKATSPAFTANATVGGPYTVTATASGVTTPADFTLTNTVVVVTSNSFSFYLSGLEAANGGPNFYALAGSVIINSDGTVGGGVQDYNDAFGITSPQPSGDSITGGALVEDASTGQGTLTLITNNANLGVSGTETLGVQFVNANHALLIQFDGSATSSGSLDLQTLPSSFSGSYAFTLTGVDSSYSPVVSGGVFSVGGTSLTSGTIDVDDNGAVTTGTLFTGTVSAPDSFGRGTITNTGIAITFNYYIVGPEVIRIVDVDALDSLIGSAYGQGDFAGGFGNSSLGASVFGVEANSWANLYAAAGQFTTTPGSGTFQGVADDDEEGTIFTGAGTGAAVSGTYMIDGNGYGNLTITSGDLGDVSVLGIYMVDPTLNILDPNNTTSGLGGALVADLDITLNGTGVILPQTDPSTASFTGNYVFGAQDYNDIPPVGWEADFVGQASVTDGVFSGTALFSDPFLSFSTSFLTFSGAPVTGTADPDLVNIGRYTMFASPLGIAIGDQAATLFDVVIYQADGGQLLWMEEDVDSLFGGSIQQQILPTPTAVKKTAAETKLNLKPKAKP
jgi:hypothetical protein